MKVRVPQRTWRRGARCEKALQPTQKPQPRDQTRDTGTGRNSRTRMAAWQPGRGWRGAPGGGGTTARRDKTATVPGATPPQGQPGGDAGKGRARKVAGEGAWHAPGAGAGQAAGDLRGGPSRMEGTPLDSASCVCTLPTDFEMNQHKHVATSLWLLPPDVMQQVTEVSLSLLSNNMPRGLGAALSVPVLLSGAGISFRDAVSHLRTRHGRVLSCPDQMCF